MLHLCVANRHAYIYFLRWFSSTDGLIIYGCGQELDIGTNITDQSKCIIVLSTNWDQTCLTFDVLNKTGYTTCFIMEFNSTLKKIRSSNINRLKRKKEFAE